MFSPHQAIPNTHTHENYWKKNIYRLIGKDWIAKTKPIGLHPTDVNLRLCFNQYFNFPLVFIKATKTSWVDNDTI